MREAIIDALITNFWWLRQNYYVYRRQTALLILLGVLFEVMVFTQDAPADGRYMLAVYGEVLLPQLAGWIVTGILVGDPSRELLFVTCRPVWKTVIERLELIVLAAAFSFGSLFLLTWLMKEKEFYSVNGLNLFLGGMVSCLLFASIGMFSSVWLRNRIAGGIVLTALWALALLFRQTILASEMGHIIYPFLTLSVPDSPFWLVNRLTLTVVSLLLILGTVLLSRHEEPLLPHGESEEA